MADLNIDYILDRVDLSNLHHWLWTGNLHRGGYAYGARGQVQRLSYETFVGPIPSGYEIGHVDCPYRHCVSPACLSAMTIQQNNDMIPTELRGFGRFNREKTHCPQGHPYSPENTYTFRRVRFCKVCRNRRQQRWRSRNWQT